MASPSLSLPGKPRVLHFVTGGFSGATQVAIDLVDAHLRGPHFEPLLVLRRKRQTPQDRIDDLLARGLPVKVVPGWSHVATIASLARICREFQPDILVAHGFSDHLWGRYAGLLAGVPHMVHVEHNPRERYTRWRLAQTRWLARRTHLLIGASEGIRDRLIELGMPPQGTVAIPNGIRLTPYAAAEDHPYLARAPGIVMAARFAKQKDHETVIRACAILRGEGRSPKILFAGEGTYKHKRRALELVRRLDLQDNIQFLGHCSHVNELLMQNQICLLSTHYEATTLALIEGMAAGCLAIGSAVTGVQELIRHGEQGLLFEEGNPESLAQVLRAALDGPEKMQEIAARGRRHATQHHSQQLSNDRYESALLSLLNR